VSGSSFFVLAFGGLLNCMQMLFHVAANLFLGDEEEQRLFQAGIKSVIISSSRFIGPASQVRACSHISLQ
jgi:hypothetical protein